MCIPQDLLTQISRQLADDRTAEIKSRLSEYLMREVSHSEFLHIASTRMSVNVFQTSDLRVGSRYELYLDNIPIATWTDEIKLRLDGQNLNVTIG